MQEENLNQPLVSVIVLNYNGMKHTPACIDSLLKQNFHSFEIIIIDNASTDGSVEFLEKQYPDLKMIKSIVNLGFVANNLGFKESKARYQVVLNNDTVVSPSFLEELVKPAENDETVGMVSAKILSIHNRNIIDSVGVNVYGDGMSRGRGYQEIDEGQYDNDTEIFLTSGCCCLYRKAMLDETGGYDDDFFLYCEDTDLAMRGRLAGWNAVLAPRSVVYHSYSASSGSVSALKAFYVERNHLWVLWKNYPASMILLSPFASLLRYFHQAVAAVRGQGASGSFVRQNGGYSGLLSVLVKAYLSFLLTLPGTLRKRRTVMKLKRITNKDFKLLCKRFSMTASDFAYK